MERPLSAKVGTNADLFPDILQIHVLEGSRILDMTYGRGVFWKFVDKRKYDLITNDLYMDANLRVDFRDTGLPESFFDAVVLDPPYMHSTGGIKASLSDCYKNNDSIVLKTQKDIRNLYLGGIKEAHRLLKDRGILIVKCQDAIESGKENWNHVAIMTVDGFHCVDLFVLVQKSRPLVAAQWKTVRHARKNHSFFVVLRKE
jgi:hypothetical protein